MASTSTQNFSLAVELDDFIRKHVASGQYDNASEVVHAGLCFLVERQNALVRPMAPAVKRAQA